MYLVAMYKCTQLAGALHEGLEVSCGCRVGSAGTFAVSKLVPYGKRSSPDK